MQQRNEVLCQRILERVLRAIVLNRVPGYHFAGNFFGTLFGQADRDVTELAIEPDVHITDQDGKINIGAVALLADVAMGASIRAGMDPTTRLATTSMHLQLTGVAATGPLEATSAFQGYFKDGAGQQGMSKVTVRQGSEPVCFGSAMFMVVPPPDGKVLAPFPRRGRNAPPVALPDIEGLDSEERWIVDHAEASLAAASIHKESFISRFLGYDVRPGIDGATSTMMNGPHVGNRVGHVQGGILLGLAAVTAQAALGEHWGLTSISASFIRPGQGKEIDAQSRIVHSGRLTAVVRTDVTSQGKQALEVLTTHTLLDPVAAR